MLSLETLRAERLRVEEELLAVAAGRLIEPADSPMQGFYEERLVFLRGIRFSILVQTLIESGLL